MTSYRIHWPKPASYPRTTAIVVLSPTRVRFEFEGDRAAEYDEIDAERAAAEWAAERRDRGAIVSKAAE